jgi:hypothetical protein
MGRLTKILLVLVVLTVTSACAEFTTKDFEIVVTGDGGLSFHGSYMATQPSGESASRSIEGTTPASYRVKGNIVSVVFQKKGENGLLRVEIRSGGNVIASEYTTAAYGVVQIATR